jgi:ribonuclease VapC
MALSLKGPETDRLACQVRFGQGRHRAGLNIGDCFANALAIEAGQALLFNGDDFSHTDVPPALGSEPP